jgi:16S rRNA (adenine1518-N6/adenine1519-N6)-dimethyltransferase
MEKLKPKKSLGQHFLTDSSVALRIVEAAEIREGDDVLEIGPGTGALTGRLLAKRAHVVAVELDHDLVVRLGQAFEHSEGLSILEGNILEFDVNERLAGLGFEDGTYKVVANIPYYITAPIVKMLLSLSVRPERIVLMVQKEVAERLCAPPGSMSILSVMAQYYADAEKLFLVSKEMFDPVPKVDSAVIRLVPKRVFDRDADRKLFRVVRAGFAARRKTLSNNLSSSFHIPKADAEKMLASLGLSPNVRAQELTVPQWEKLSELIGN